MRNANTANDIIATFCGAYTNVLVSSQVQIASGSGSVSVGARLGGYSGGIPSQGYTAEIVSDGTVLLWRVDNWTLLGSSSISGFSLGTWYTLALRANGNQISVEVNGSPVIGPVTNTAFTSGDAGVWSYQPTSTGSHRYDNFSVTVLGGGFHTKTKGLAMIAARRILALHSAPPANTTWRVYYYANGKPIAMREMPAGNNTGTLYYLHSDHLGSTSVTTCGSGSCGAAGGVVARQWYYPFGSVRGSYGTLPTQRTFNNQYADSTTRLMYFNARYYSGALGRFVSADTVVPGTGNPQALNRYSLSFNNPVKYIDPSGHEPCETGTGIDCQGGTRNRERKGPHVVKTNFLFPPNEKAAKALGKISTTAQVAATAFSVGSAVAADMVALTFGAIGGVAAAPFDGPAPIFDVTAAATMAGAAYRVGKAVYQKVGDPIENSLGYISYGATIFSDAYSGRSRWEEYSDGRRNLVIGDSTVVGLPLVGLGAVNQDPNNDAIIDIVASAYATGHIHPLQQFGIAGKPFLIQDYPRYGGNDIPALSVQFGER